MKGVEWHNDARDQLADIWVMATELERVQFEVAIVRLERLLTEDPFAVGESRSGSIRVEMALPLVFWFDVATVPVRIISVTRSVRK